MMRRRHKKSRRGCLECKRRHIKCDETRPQCINCTTAERDCSYPRATSSDGTSTGHSPVEGPAGARYSVSASPPMTSYAPAPTSGLMIGGDMPSFGLGGPAGHLPDINMVHMELLHHYLTNDLTSYPEMAEHFKHVSMRHALREPYLMYQILALAARHLCYCRPESAVFYQTQAIQLQTRALSLFNSLDVGYFDRSISNLATVFLFSSQLGVQALCDMLSYRDHDFPSALARFMGYLRLHRGVHRVLDGHRAEMVGSDVGPILELGVQWYNVGGEGHECDDIRRRIMSVPDLDAESLDATLKAIDLLQWVIDGEPRAAGRAHVLLSWTTMIGRSFVDLLEAGRPEALAVLAYYFLVLHYCREVWVFGSSGQYFLTSLSNYLGPEWAPWIETPCRLLRQSLEREDAESLDHVDSSLFLADPGQHSVGGGVYWKQPSM
ncbi:hypothetical protein B0H66DRAFT_604565 [Apodospora peruviana]|uniref:Zn(2)-C6 fungal-type domain-containing protein n=1 Tax=Apodospora peruviana TaxID=516989 RepID=A0AAE0M253_9PEZI|nr:hypothetical protein B0H66DRAFT_604565 [Apodospora peruviana]